MEKNKKIKICKYKSFTILIFAFLVIFPIKISLAYNSEKTTERVTCNEGDVVCLINDSLSLVKKNIPDFSNLDNKFEFKPKEFSVNKKINLTATVADISLPLSSKVSTNNTSSFGSSLTSVADDLAYGWNFFIDGLLNNFIETGIAVNNAVIRTDNGITNAIVSNNNTNTSKQNLPSVPSPNNETLKTTKTQIIPSTIRITKTETKVIQGPQGLRGLVGPQGPKGESGNSINVSNLVSEVLFSRQVSKIFDSISENIKVLSSSLTDEVETKSLIVSGDANINGDLTITGNLTGNVVGVINPSFALGSIPFQGASGLTENNTNLFWDSANSRLGVGTITPSEKISVQGNILATGSINGSNISGINTGDETNSSIKTKLGVATNLVDGYLSSNDWTTFNNKQPAGNYLTSSNLSGLIPYTGGNTNVDLGLNNLTVDINTLFVDHINHKVGIGTNTPTLGKLEVKSTDLYAVTPFVLSIHAPSQSPYIGGFFNDTKSTTIPVATYFGYDNGDFNMGTLQGKFFLGAGGSLALGSTPRLTIDNTTGNVGIGTTSPNDALTVTGNIVPTVSSGGSLGIPSKYWTTSYIAGLNMGSGQIGSIAGVVGSTDFFIKPYSSSYAVKFMVGSTEYMRMNGDGNIGIGTTAPNQQLEITKNFRLPTTTGTTPYGIIYKGSSPFISDFSYGLNSNSITPTGNNIFIGIGTGNLTTGSTATVASQSSFNTIIGSESFTSNTTGFNNTSLGYRTLTSNTTGNNNMAIGILALYSNTTGTNNTAIGRESLFANVTSSNNTANGAYALSSTTAGNNTASGYASMVSNTTGSLNTAYGYQSARYISDGITERTTGNNGLYLGGNSKASDNGTDNEIVIGYNAVGQGSNTVTLGNTNVTKTLLNGNVGIGTTSPTNALSVVGAVQVLSNPNGFYTTYGPNGIYSGANNFNFQTYNGSSVITPLFINASAGNVGIGTMSPSYALHVVGTVGATNGIFSSDGYFGAFKPYGTGNDLIFKNNGGTELVRIKDGGNVGIGTTNPSNILTAGFSSNSTTQSNSAVLNIFNSDSTVNNMANISFGQSGSSSNGFSRLGVINTDRTSGSEDQDMFLGTIGGGIYEEKIRITSVGNVGIGTINPTARLEVLGFIKVPDNRGLMGTSYGENTLIPDYSTGGHFNRFRALSGQIFETYSGGTYNEKMRLTDVGNLGIGTTNPIAKLQIGPGGSDTTLSFNLGATNTYSSIQSYNSSLALNPSGNNVGIGTTSPSELLDIAGISTAGTSLRIYNNSTAYGDRGIIKFNGNTAGGGNTNTAMAQIVGGHTSAGNINYLDFKVGAWNNNNTISSTMMRINSLGNVGIGTTSPAGKLNVATTAGDNNIYADDYSTNTGHSNYWFSRRSHNATLGTLTTTVTGEALGAFYFQGVDAAGNFDYGARMVAVQNGTAGSYVPTDLIFYTQSAEATNTNQLVLSNTGNVGIGTTSPTSKLYVDNGDISIGGATSSLQGLNFYENNGKSMSFVYDGVDNSLNIRDENNLKLVSILRTGNVGIGTTSPGSKFEVVSATGGVNSGIKLTQLAEGVAASSYAPIDFSVPTTGLVGQFLATANNYSNPAADLASNSIALSASVGQLSLRANSANGFITLHTNGARRMTIDSSGNVGIGTTTPTLGKLQIEGAAGSTLLSLNNTNANWGMSIDSNTIPNFYIGSVYNSTYAMANYFWRANWNTAGVAHNTFQNPSTGVSGLTVMELKQHFTGDTGDYLNITSNGGTSGNLLTVDKDGNVGIGTTAPGGKLHVEGGKFVVNSTNSSYGQIQVTNPSVGEATIVLGAGITSGWGGTLVSSNSNYLWAFGPGSYGNTPDKFIIGNNGIGGSALSVLAPSGNVGIGTSTPVAKLDIQGGNVRIGNTIGGDTLTVAGNISVEGAGGPAKMFTTSFYNPNGYAFSYWTGSAVANAIQWDSTPRVSIPNGNLGIGTTSPATALDVLGQLNLKATSSQIFGIRMQNRNATQSWVFGTDATVVDDGKFYLAKQSSAPSFSIDPNFNVWLGGASTTNPTMAVQANGNVGIGTTTPLATLQVNTPATNSAGNGIRINRPGSTYYSGLEYTTNGTVDWAQGVNSAGFGIYEDGQAATTRLLIQDGGNVGIGTTSPGEKLEVAGNIRIGNATDAILNFNSTITSGASNLIIQPSSLNNTPQLILRPSGTSTTPPVLRLTDTYNDATGSHSFNFGTGNATLPANTWNFASTIAGITNQDSWPIGFLVSNATAGRFTAMTIQPSGNVGIGTTGPGYKLDVLYTTANSTGANAIRVKSSDSGSTAEFRAENDLGYSARMFKLGSTYSSYKTLAPNDIGFYNANAGNISILNDVATGKILFAAGAASTPQMLIDTNGNVGIGTTTPTGKLHVVGSSTVATDIIKLSAGSGTFFVNNVTSNSIGPIIDYDINASATITNFIRLGNGTMATGVTNGITQNIITSTPTISTASNSTTFNVLNIAPTVNQTGTANGISRGIYVNPTLTAASDFRAIETNVVSGTGRYGYYGAGTAISYFGGNVGIGTTGPTAVLHLKAGIATAGTAPIKLTAGTVNTTPEAGAMEYDGTNLYFTPNTTRETISTKTYTDTKLALLVMGDTKEISGFVDGSNIDISYNHTNRTVTLTGNLDYYWRGVKYTLTSPWTSTAHTNSVGSWFLSTTDGTNFTWSNSPWSFSDAQVALVNYQSTAEASFIVRETHGLMDSKSHELFHSQVGTYRYTGGQLTAGTYTVNTASDAANSPGFDPAVIKDEDLSTTIPTWTEGTYTTMYVGASDTAVFNTTATLPFISAGSYLQVNNPTTGSMTNGINNRYYNVYQIMIPVGSNSDSQKYRMVMLQPQATHTSLASATAEDVRNLKFGNLSSLSNEFIVYSRITYITGTADVNTGKARITTGGVTYVVGNRAGQVSVSGFAANDHASLSNLTWLTSGHLGNVNTVPAFNTSGVVTELTMTGTGTTLALATTPTFTTNITTPLVLGGSTTTSDLNLQTTSGVGATGADMHFLVGNNGATEAMTILNGGNVGIGTTNPTTLLQVGDSSNINNALINLNSQSNTDAGLIMNEGAGNVITGTGYGFKLFYNGVDQNRFIIQSMEGAGYVDRLAINRTSGNIGIGNTNPSYQLQVGNNTVSGIVARFENSTGTCDINPTTASLACSSDISLKKNITTLENSEFILNENIDTSFTTLEKILALTPVLYNWNNENDSTNKHVGFIAQEVEQVFPDLVFTDPNKNLKSISYTNLIPYTVKAIQEMDLIVKDLSSLDTSKDNSLGSLIAQFLAEQATFAKEFTANIFHVNGDVCVDDVCITKEEFKQMLINAKGTANTDVTTPEIEVTTTVLPPPVATPPVEIENPPVVENEIVTNPLIPIDTEPVITPPIETVTEPINDTTTVLSLPESPVSDESSTMPSED